MPADDSLPNLIAQSQVQPPGEQDIESNAAQNVQSNLTLSGTAGGKESKQTLPPEIITDFGFLPIPNYLRYHHDKPHNFGLLRTIAFGFASTFTLANLYYCQPLLIQLALSFNVSYGDVSHIPTLFQAGYAAGLIFISPLGDLLRRRPLILAMVSGSMCLTVGLAVTQSLLAFQVLSFIVGILGVTPPILVTLAADIAPPHKRGGAIAVVLSGLIFGILIARVLGGIIGDFAPWRVVYYFAIGVQGTVLAVCYFVLPDYPPNNKDRSYAYILGTMSKFAITEPQLMQAIPITIASAACFSNFWVTITFLLGEAPYSYSTLVIGLFGLIGMAGVAVSPFVGRLMRGL
ncbi:hypothetical protein D9619_007480 [Psilocybe cf. subviscida]|uniref:Major facilitator superfamily (MFS) profile domain-containing protein n=1 Tax=Psilocybe cf. subviscida TaxID=2480587 RepID=A0A8H5EWW4_9AGAR|nr:hypothetical protein D9619_007480 [Psilocybe cf. subviscida]